MISYMLDWKKLEYTLYSPKSVKIKKLNLKRCTAVLKDRYRYKAVPKDIQLS